MGKCILFSRVSTEQQTIESQTQTLKEEAIKLGYKEKDLILIEQKESGIKLDEEERIGLQRLKDNIFKDETIDCVICYEVSRLSRKPKVLYSIRDFLLDRQIQLIILKPYLRVMEDGKLSESASLMFSIYASFSEIEMSAKKTRMMRNRKYNMQKGLYGGGWLAFGYKIGNKKIVEINEKEAKIVRKIYDMYETGLSALSIARELMELGELPQLTNTDAAMQFVLKTVSREQYVGAGKGTNYILPQIITQEQYDRCKAIRNNKAKPKTGTSILYFGHGLIHDELNHILTPSKANGVYGSYDINTKKFVTVSLNLIDSIIWHIAKEHIKNNTIPNIEDQRKEINDRLEEVKKRITTIDRQIEEQNKKIDRAEKMIIDGLTTTERGAKHIMDARRIISELETKQDELRYKEGKIMNEYIYINSFLYETDGADNSHIDDITDEKEMHKLIKQAIRRIDIVKDISGIMGRYWLTFTFTDNKKEIYKIRSTGPRKDLYDEHGNVIHYKMMKRVIPRHSIKGWKDKYDDKHNKK